MLFTAGPGNIQKENRNRQKQTEQIVFKITQPQCLRDFNKVLSSQLSNNRGGWNSGTNEEGKKI